MESWTTGRCRATVEFGEAEQTVTRRVKLKLPANNCPVKARFRESLEDGEGYEDGDKDGEELHLVEARAGGAEKTASSRGRTYPLMLKHIDFT